MNIVILGGGTAGWLTALLAREFYLQHNITVVESDEIGILGAGEGTVPHIVSVLDTIGIPVSDLVRECEATLKLGVRFTNWNSNNRSFFHGFSGGQNLAWNSCDVGPYFQHLLCTTHVAQGLPVDDLVFSQKLANVGKVPFAYTNNIASPQVNPILRLQNHGQFALHFNARLLATYLQKVAINRNINRVEGKVKKIKSNKKGNITELVLENGKSINADFVFDCSGFARVLVGKHFKTEWQSYNEHLPLDTALPFFIPHDNINIKPETESIAMKYGWMWKIPVQGRYGCGYVFDSSFITKEEAQQEVEEYLGHSIESPKTFKFNAGSYKETYVKNCMAVGLAQSFVEPLEATSIWVSCQNLIQFLQHNGVRNTSTQFQDWFNSECNRRNDEIVAFLYLHYMTDRTDTEFWKTFKTRMKPVTAVNNRLALWNDVPPGSYDNSDMFMTNSWLQVADGKGLLNQDAFIKRSEDLSLAQRVNTRHYSFLTNQNNLVNTCLSHKEFLDFLSS